ncbi:hypothetical protein [Dyella sp.]|jgi:hypothetical protein|uniref:hypothetical protein n=1 Tax=Dyella sp. TaxID=1869338 RepID=UPI002D7943EB|nr:hypothetical protein [Dyella sp.]HET6432362.1 hypothetical protein [Dyella sp.]
MKSTAITRRVITTSALALASLLPLAACSQTGAHNDDNAAQAVTEAHDQSSPSMISEEIHKGMQQARKELLTQDIDINNVHVGHDRDNDGADHRDLPKAVITPQGNLVIAGNTVSATPEQHTMLVDYRQQIIGIAEAGMEIGEHGANLGTQAAKEAIWGALTGKSDKEIEARIKPQTAQIEAAAAKLCLRLPDMLASQQKLAAAMPEFRPYATMTQKDVEECGKDDGNDD